MSSALVLIVVVVGGYLAAHVASDWLGRRFLVVSGAEYLLLGILLGPQVSGLIGADVFGGFAPFLTLALGWVGVVVGAQFSLPELVRIPAPPFRIAFFEALLTLVAVSAAMLAVFTGLLGTLPEEAVFPAVALGAVATASAPTGIGLVARRLGWRGPVVRQLQLATAIDALVAIVAFSLLLTLGHGCPPRRRPLAHRDRVGGDQRRHRLRRGALFHLFLGASEGGPALHRAGGRHRARQGRGDLPAPLAAPPPCCRGHPGEHVEQPRRDPPRRARWSGRSTSCSYFAGAAWAPSTRAWVSRCSCSCGALVGKVGGARLAARLNDLLPVLGRRWGRRCWVRAASPWPWRSTTSSRKARPCPTSSSRPPGLGAPHGRGLGAAGGDGGGLGERRHAERYAAAGSGQEG